MNQKAVISFQRKEKIIVDKDVNDGEEEETIVELAIQDLLTPSELVSVVNMSVGSAEGEEKHIRSNHHQHAAIVALEVIDLILSLIQQKQCNST